MIPPKNLKTHPRAEPYNGGMFSLSPGLFAPFRALRFRNISVLRGALVGPSASLSQLTRGLIYRQSLVAEYHGGLPRRAKLQRVLGRVLAVVTGVRHLSSDLLQIFPEYSPASTCGIRNNSGSPSRSLQASQFGRTDLTARWAQTFFSPKTGKYITHTNTYPMQCA